MFLTVKYIPKNKNTSIKKTGLLLTAAVVLIGGNTTGTGNVFARNPTTGIYGPVCDDNWDILDVRFS